MKRCCKELDLKTRRYSCTDKNSQNVSVESGRTWPTKQIKKLPKTINEIRYYRQRQTYAQMICRVHGDNYLGGKAETCSRKKANR